MTRIGFIFCVLLTTQSAQAQVPDSVLFSLSFYPLETGDFWQYEQGSQHAWSSSDFGVYPYKKVLGDTTFSNGKDYKVVEYGSTSIRIKFERVDSTDLIVYEYAPGRALQAGLPNEEIPRFLLPQSNDSSFEVNNGPLTCKWDNTRMILGEEKRPWSCNWGQGYSNYIEYAVSQLGIGHYFESQESYFFSQELIYFKTSTQQLGVAVGTTEQPEHPEVNNLEIYPNPAGASDTITLQGNFLAGKTSLRLWDLLGRSVPVEFEFASNTVVRFRMPPSSPNGVYFISATGAAGRCTQRFILVSSGQPSYD